MQARPLDAFAATLVFALCVVWGFNQVVVKLALPDVGPIAQTGVRSGIGALCVIAYALCTKRRIFEIDGTEVAGALAGALFTAEFIALYELLRFTTAARATVFIYAAPFFVAVGAAFLLRDERLRPIQWVGLAFAFLGVACGFLGRTKGGSLAGDALALLAAVALGGDDPCHQGDAAQAHRSDQGPSLSDRIRCANRAACGLCFRRSVADASYDGVGRLLVMARRRCGWRKLRAAYSGTLTRYAVAELSAFTFITPLVGVLAAWLVFGENFELGVLAGDRAGHRGLGSSTGRAALGLRKPTD